MARAVLATCVAVLLCAGASTAAGADASATKEVTITGTGGVPLGCGFKVPAGTAPANGWPAIVVFPGLGLTHANEDADQTLFAADGFASISCDERGTGSSGGSFDLAGPTDAQDAQAIFNWLVAQPSVSPTKIGAYGENLGGAEVWDAAVAHVPFKAIVPAYTWSSLARALRPTGALDTRALSLFAAEGSQAWNTTSGIAARAYRGHLHALTVPTLIVQSRQDYRWDLSQATAAYRLLAGPKRLSIVWSQPQSEVEAWFTHYLAGGPKVGSGVEIQHESPYHAITKFLRSPQTRVVSVNLPGSALTRSVWLTGGPLETFGGGNVTIRYTGASWKQVVATVATASGTEVTEGAAPLTKSAGVLKIPLLNEVRLLPRGKTLVVTLSSHDATFGGASGGTIAVGRVTLKLSVLQRAVSH